MGDPVTSISCVTQAYGHHFDDECCINLLNSIDW